MSSAMLQITPIMPVTILMTGLEDLMPELIETAHITTRIVVNKDPDFISYYPPKESALLIFLKYCYIIVRVVVVVIFEIIDEFGLDPERLAVEGVKLGRALEDDSLAAVEEHLVYDLLIVFKLVLRNIADAVIRSAEFGHASGVDPVAVIFLGEHYEHVILSVNFVLLEKSLIPFRRRIKSKCHEVQDSG